MRDTMRRIILIFLINGLFLAGFGWAALPQGDIQKFKKYNPDKQKYEFVKNYLASLNYLNLNGARDEKIQPVALDDLIKERKVEELKNSLNLDNVNLRIARNLLKKFHNPGNGLILKSVDLFMRMCDEQIGFNQSEKDLLDQLHDLQISGGLSSMDKEKFGAQLRQLAAERKESLKKMLEASMLMHKILVSEKTDSMGEFSRLGITREEREKLLTKLKEYFGDLGSSGLKEGQSFLEGSVAAIRAMLEDTSWSALDS